MKVPYLFNPGINLLAFVFAAAIGVIFGYVPAERTARLDPIEALRHESRPPRSPRRSGWASRSLFLSSTWRRGLSARS